MSTHRLENYFAASTSVGLAPAGPAFSVSGFMMCPLFWQAGAPPVAWQQVYQLAYAQAQAVLRPSRLERLQRVSPN